MKKKTKAQTAPVVDAVVLAADLATREAAAASVREAVNRESAPYTDRAEALTIYLRDTFHREVTRSHTEIEVVFGGSSPRFFRLTLLIRCALPTICREDQILIGSAPSLVGLQRERASDQVAASDWELMFDRLSSLRATADIAGAWLALHPVASSGE